MYGHYFCAVRVARGELLGSQRRLRRFDTEYRRKGRDLLLHGENLCRVKHDEEAPQLSQSQEMLAREIQDQYRLLSELLKIA